MRQNYINNELTQNCERDGLSQTGRIEYSLSTKTANLSTSLLILQLGIYSLSKIQYIF
jgi:hypothetical protein